MDAQMLDGNAAAGLLQEVFAVEVTTMTGTCVNCGAAEPIGAIHVFTGAGVVLRCPHCEHDLMKIVRSGTRTWVSLQGVSALELAQPPG
jgi:Zn finger protein HypA/HybF involved in hydrogenase expression